MKPNLHVLSVFVGLLAGVMTGCTNLTPQFQRPELPVADQFTRQPINKSTSQTEVSSVDAQAFSLVGWQQFFNDEVAQQLITLALANNRDLAIAAANVAEMKGLYRIQQSENHPRFTSNLDSTVSRPSVNVTGSDEITRQYGAQIGLVSYEIDFWGRVASLREAALADYFSQIAAQRATRINVIAETANAYYAWLMAAETLALADKTLANRRESLKLIEARNSVGLASQLDVTQAQIAESSVKSQKANAQRNLAALSAVLTQLIGKPIDDLLDPTESLATQVLNLDIPDGLSTEVLLGRPDIIQAEFALKAANARIGAARAAFFPQINLLGSGGFASASLDNLFESDALTWSFAPSLRLPLFNQQIDANLSVAEARNQKAVAEYEKVIQTAFAEVYTQLLARKALADERQAQQDLVAAEKKRLRLSKARYEAGLASYLPVLEAQQALFAAEQSLLAIQKDLLSANIMLYKALGGADQENPSPKKPSQKNAAQAHEAANKAAK
ncbi:efflux transporter outer membrane subunit [Ostreibacterium oceani]|uniref:Efflux transporter outer membrane subunit n=1 Tax=Ostreibacterium oceani TaxID=2654998 RepID=A0A6N7ER89_9GAMM|nr:efflux transporter outer membrane subunit [Ostreibacterium oceani]MPV85384.1 efflux transporter outer membrane subunit [Ostreibacterium oceani]